MRFRCLVLVVLVALTGLAVSANERHVALPGTVRRLMQAATDPDADPGDTDVADQKTTPKTTTSKTAATAAATTTAAAAPAAKKAAPKKSPVINKVVAFAPAANITNGDDIADDGQCEDEIEKLCKGIDQGEGKWADCISDAIAESELGEGEGTILAISDACREEVYQYKISRNSNINMNIPLARACKEDAEKFCNVTWFFGYKAGQVSACLKEVYRQVSTACKLNINKMLADSANDFRADPELYHACKDDGLSLCPKVQNGGGRIQGCLRDARLQLSWSCEEQLFRQEMESADDIRLSVRLYGRCLADKKKFCKNIEPGNARAKECLEEHREELSEPCKDEIVAMIERRVHDFRLDPKLRDTCQDEIFNLCAYFGDLDDIDTYDSSVINCLQDYSSEIKSQACKDQVHKYVELAASDIRFDVPLAEACFDDRQKYCANVPPGSARVIRCLTKKREKLSPVCRATLFDEEVRFSENIDFQAPMKAACEREIDKFCHDVPHGNGRVIRCLQDKKDEKDFGKGCREEVEAYEAEISQDYRLNYRLKTACQLDIQSLCPGACQQSDGQGMCGGKVLRCLTDKFDDIKSEACVKEVHYFEKMEVTNFQNDVILAEACRSDVDKLCANVQPGEGRVHQCLRDNRDKLSEKCRKEELLLEEKEANSIELSVNLMKACKPERQLFCRDVQAGSARVFRCLAENMNDADFGARCKAQIIYKLQRRQANWKLDPPLRKACRDDVSKLCSAEDGRDSEQGLVYKCMIKNHDDLSSGCQKEVGRAFHMALFAWQPSAILTSPCDDDIQRLCLAKRPSMAQRPGAVGSCLASILERQDRASSSRRLLPEMEEESEEEEGDAGAAAAGRKLSPQCFELANIAEPPNIKRAFESSLSFAALAYRLDTVGSSTGLPLTARDRRGNVRGISLTGWVAMGGMAALVVLVLFAVALFFKRVCGGRDHAGYAMVVKSQPK